MNERVRAPDRDEVAVDRGAAGDGEYQVLPSPRERNIPSLVHPWQYCRLRTLTRHPGNVANITHNVDDTSSCCLLLTAVSSFKRKKLNKKGNKKKIHFF